MKKPFTKLAAEVILQAQNIASELGQTYIGTEHILAALAVVEDSVAKRVLNHQGINYEAVYSLLEKTFLVRHSVAVDDGGDFSPKAKKMLESAGLEAGKCHSDEVGTEHLLIALVKEPDCAAGRMLTGLGANKQKILAETFNAMGEDLNKHKEELADEKNRGRQKKAARILDDFSTDLCSQVREGKLDPVIGRDDEIERVVQILSRRTKNNPCLVGEPGVGKTAIVEALAARIVNKEISGPVASKRILSLDLPAMVAGSKYRGEFEERVKKVINEVKEDGHIVLFMDEIHTMIGAGGAEGSIDAANILKPALSRGEIQIIGATTLDEYRKHFEKDAALERRFQPVYVEQPDKEQTVLILKGIRKGYEEHHNVEITDEAVNAAVDLSMRYINDRYLPDKAIDLIDEAASKVRLASYILPPEIRKEENSLKELDAQRKQAIIEGHFDRASDVNIKMQRVKDKIRKQDAANSRVSDERLSVTAEDIAEVVSRWTKVPVRKLKEEESEKLMGLAETLKKRVLAQDEAVEALARAIRRGRVGLKDPKKPIGSFLFLGPTGVGKTELSKALAEAMFGTENSIIRVDMSEYMEKHSVSKLIGSPPGYVGYDEGGQLSEQVRRNPYSIILFDEIEKAHPDVFNILLQVLDDGRITDSHGRMTDFKNTIIIMTSNAGASRIMEPKNLGFMADNSEETGYNLMKNAVMDEVKRTFKPEFINRVDEIIVFRALNEEDAAGIADIILKEIIDRAKAQMGLAITVTKKARLYLVEQGFDKKYGARSLKRKIQSAMEDELAEEILTGRIKAGDRVRIDMKQGQLSFRVINKKA